MVAQRAHDQGVHLAPEKLTVAEFLQQWLESVRNSVRPKTFTRYEQYVRLHITPTIGSRVLARLTPQQVSAAYSLKLDAGLSTTTVAHMHAVLHSALRQAVRWDLAGRNVTELVNPPRIEHKQMTTFSPESPSGRLFPLAPQGMRAVFRRLERGTGLKANPHSFRRGFATELRRKGVSELDIAQPLVQTPLAHPERASRSPH